MSKEDAISGRKDVSRFLVHLTRDDRKDNKSEGATARKNLLSILRNKEISAVRPHNLFNLKLDKLQKKERVKFDVVCLTEVPLDQIHLLTKTIPGRQVNLQPYGLVFTRDFIIASKGQPALYLNGYGGNKFLHEAAHELFNVATKGGKVEGPLWRLLPFLNAMHEKYDFTWEREWRVLGSLTFKSSDLVCLILPGKGEEDMKEAAAKGGIAVVSPEWGYEAIVAELAAQQRSTRKVTRELLKKK